MPDAQYTLSLPSMEVYSINPLLTLALAITPLLLFFLNSVSYKHRLVLLCLSLSLIQSLHRAGGDLVNYTIALNTSSIWEVEPFWFVFYFLNRHFALNTEFTISLLYFSISIMFFASILCFLNGQNLKEIFYGSLVAAVMFGPALYQAQIRLSLSVGFTYLSIYFYRKSIPVLGTLMSLLSISSHSTAILLSPLTTYLSFANDVDHHLKLLIIQARAKKALFLALSILVLCLTLALVVLAPRYLTSESNQFQLGQASGSFAFDLASSSVIFLLFQLSLNADFSLRFAYTYKYLPSRLFHHIISISILLGFIGWLGRFKSWFYPYISLAIVNNYRVFLLPVVLLFIVRNIRLYFIVDPSYMIFLF